VCTSSYGDIITFNTFQSAVHRSFALADNLGEVSAKAQVCINAKDHCLVDIPPIKPADVSFGFQIQTVCFDNLGLLLAASLNVICKNNQRFVFSIFGTLVLLSYSAFNLP